MLHHRHHEDDHSSEMNNFITTVENKNGKDEKTLNQEDEKSIRIESKSFLAILMTLYPIH